MPKRKLRSVAEIEEACELMLAQLDKAARELLLSDIDPAPDRQRAEVVAAVLGVLSWIAHVNNDTATIFAKSLERLRERFPEVASPPSAQPDQPEPMTFSEAVAEFDQLCEKSGKCEGKYRTLEAKYNRRSHSVADVTYRAYVADVLYTECMPSLEAVLAEVTTQLDPPPEQDVAAALDGVDAHALAVADDNGMAPAAVPDGLPEPAVFDSAEEDAAHAE